MFKKPSKESKAIPIIRPQVLVALPLRPPNHHKASNGVSSQRDIGPVVQKHHLPPAEIPSKTQDSGKNSRPVEPGISADESSAFNIYARPFVPQAFLDINQQTGAAFLATKPKKTIDFVAYAEQSFGPAVLCLGPHPVGVPPQPLPPNGTTSLVPQNYMPYFEHHLKCEADVEICETEASCLYGHELTIHPNSTFSHSGETLCSLEVPGIRENTPFVEEEDIVELRQLSYKNPDDPSSPGFNQVQGWTQVVYHARIANTMKATETLVLRVQGLSETTMKIGSRFNVKFYVPIERRLPMFRSVQDAHLAVADGGWLYSVLFPSNHDCEIQERLHSGVFNHKFLDPQLNWEQKKAVESILTHSYGSLPCKYCKIEIPLTMRH